MKPSHPTYEETAKKVRNQLRPYNATSVVQRALTLINSVRNADIFDQLQTWPWITLLLVKLVLEDKMISFNTGENCPQNVFDRCRQELWDAQAGRDRFGSEGGDNMGNVYLMLRSLLQAQLPFQKNISWDFLRWPALIARLAPDHPTRVQFVDRLGMAPEDFACLCFAAYYPALNNETIFKLDFFEPLRPHFGAALDRFLDEFSRDLAGLRTELRRQLGARIAANEVARSRKELSEFPWLSNYPLLKISDRRLLVWHPIVFARGLESAVHKRLSERREDYAKHFSKVFEDYVLELLAEAGLCYLDEKTYKDGVGADNHAVEAIITSVDANVFIESKMTAYSDNLILSDRGPMVWQNLKRVREAMNQGWMVSSRLRGGDTPTWNCTSAIEDFLVIVTSQQMSCATGEHFRRMFKHDIFEPTQSALGKVRTPTTEQLERLPLKNIVITSIEEFEHLMGCVLKGEIDLVAFLREVAAAHSDPKTSVFFIDQLLGPKTKEWRITEAIDQARLRAEATLMKVLSL